uniref:Uncharacterized protein n=1 Tax=Arundo donax TaxID=35708 RepID=A0A0A8Z9K0_ARUDO
MVYDNESGTNSEPKKI